LCESIAFEFGVVVVVVVVVAVVVVVVVVAVVEVVVVEVVEVVVVEAIAPLNCSSLYSCWFLPFPCFVLQSLFRLQTQYRKITSWLPDP